jgi:hypothetical protein
VISRHDIAFFKPSLHWQCLAQYHARFRPRYCAVYTYLGSDITQDGQGKYYSDCLVLLSRTVSLTNVANVNYPILALANRNDPICVVPPKVAKASKEGTLSRLYRGRYHAKLRQWKQGLRSCLIGLTFKT